MGLPIWRRVLSLANVLTAVFLIAVLVQMAHHVMWRDEIRTWQICREATGPFSLWYLMRFDAVPFAWNWIVFVLTRITDNPISMQIVHALIAAAVVYVVARWGHFSPLNKVLFAFGYFPFFEYAVLARSYSLLFLLLMIACVLISRPRVPLIGLAIVCFFMAQVSIWGLGFAMLMFPFGVAKAYWTERDPPMQRKRAAIGMGIILLGAVVCAAQLFPGPGQSFRDQWNSKPMIDRFLFTVGTIYRAWVPLPALAALEPYPRLVKYFWNSNFLDFAGADEAPLGLAMFCTAAFLLIRRPLAMALLVVGTLGLLGFTFISFQGYNRHFGHLFMLMIAAYWLADVSPPWMNDWAAPARHWLMVGLLAVQALIGLLVAVTALHRPFSATRAVADYIEQQDFKDKVVLVGIFDYPAAPIAQWLDRPIYYVQERKFARFYTQDDAARFQVTRHAGDILNAIYDAALSKRQFVLLMLNSQLRLPMTSDSVEMTFPAASTGQQVKVSVEKLQEFNDSVVEDEEYQLYLVVLSEQLQ